MKKYILILIVLVTFSSILFSQNTDSLQLLNDKRQFKNELALDVKNAFAILSGAQIMFKKQINPGNLIEVNAIRSLRFFARARGQISFADEVDLDTLPAINTRPHDRMDFLIGFGFEKQSIKKDLITYYGMDAEFGYYFLNDDFSSSFRYDISSGFASEDENDILLISADFVPFFGIKRYLTKRLSLSIETGFNVGGFYRRTRSITLDGIRTLEDRQEFSSYGLKASFRNLRFINLAYIF